MWISDDFLDDSVTLFGGCRRESITKDILFRVFDFVFQIASLFVAKCFAIGNQKLQIASVGTVHIGVVDFIDDAVAEGEPDAATGMISRADAFFGAPRPSWFVARRAKGGALVVNVHTGMIRAGY